MNDNPQTIGSRVRSARLAKRMSQAELARLSGVSQQSIAKIENDYTQSSRHLPRLAYALDLTLSDLDPSAADIFAGQSVAAPASKTAMLAPASVRAYANAATSAEREIPFWSLRLVNGQQIWPDGDPMATWQRIDILAGSPDAYALYVASREASPAMEPGDIILVNPDRPALIGTDCVFVAKAPSTEPRVVQLRRIKDITDTHWVVERFNPHEVSEIEMAANLYAHRIVAVIRRA